MTMNAIEEIAKTQPKENAGPPTSKRFEYQMNWGLSKLLELEESGEDYTIAFDYHDDIIVFNPTLPPCVKVSENFGCF